MVARLLAQVLGKRTGAGEIVLELLRSHHTGSNLKSNLALRRVNRYGLQVRQEGVVLLWCAQVPCAAMRVPTAVALEGTHTRHLTDSRHVPSP